MMEEYGEDFVCGRAGNLKKMIYLRLENPIKIFGCFVECEVNF